MALSPDDFVKYSKRVKEAKCTGMCFDCAIGFSRLLNGKTPSPLPGVEVLKYNFRAHSYPILQWNNVAPASIGMGDILVFVWSQGTPNEYTQRHFVVALGDGLFAGVNYAYNLETAKYQEQYNFNPIVVYLFTDRSPVTTHDVPKTSFVRIASINVDRFVASLTSGNAAAEENFIE